jgi:hypothetical protein
MIEYRTLPVPAFDQFTARFDAGPVVFGVEYRVLNEAMILEFYGDDARAKFDGKVPAGMGAVIDEDGLALHVFDHEGRELLRFDCFDDAPHYHYLDPAVPRNVVIEYDTVASGPIIPWAFRTLRTRLADMLGHVGRFDLAGALHQATVAATLDLVEAEAARMLAAGKPVAVAAS